MNLGSLRNELMMPSNTFPPEVDEDLEEMMILGTTPNWGTIPSEMQSSPPRSATAGTNSITGRPPPAFKMHCGSSGNNLLHNIFRGGTTHGSSRFSNGGCGPHFDGDEEYDGDMMGMSPDVSNMVVSPGISNPGFQAFLQRQGQGAPAEAAEGH